MAVVKANYRRIAAGGGSVAARSIGYYAQRRDRDGQQVERTGFDRETAGLDVRAMRDVIERAEGSFLYRLVLAPGAEAETHVDLKSWTRDALLELERDHGEFPWVAVEHRDQTEHAHVHVVLVIDVRLERGDLERLREAATELYEQRREWLEPAFERSEGLERAPLRERFADGEAYVAGSGDAFDEPPNHRRRDRGRSMDGSLDR